MKRDRPSSTARKVALNIVSLGAKPGMEDVLPDGIVEATARLLVAADVVGERAIDQLAKRKRPVVMAAARRARLLFSLFRWMPRKSVMRIMAKFH